MERFSRQFSNNLLTRWNLSQAYLITNGYEITNAIDREKSIVLQSVTVGMTFVF